MRNGLGCLAVVLSLASGAARAQEAPPLFEHRPKVSGFFQVFYRQPFETGEDGVVDSPNFRVQRLRIAIEGDLSPWLSYDVSIDPRAPEVGGILRDAFFSIRKLIPKHRIRIGQQKTHFGYENNTSSTRLWAVNRTEVSDNLARGVTLRDIGVGLVGSIPLVDHLRIEDGITVVNGAGMNAQDDDTDMKNVWGRIGLRYKRDGFWARFGVSAGIGDYVDSGADVVDPTDDFLVKFKRLGADLEVDHEILFVSAEAIVGRDETMGETDDSAGFYVNAVGKTPWRVGPIARVDVFGDGYRRWTLGGYYALPDEPFRVLLTYELREKMDDLRGDDKLYLWTQVRF